MQRWQTSALAPSMPHPLMQPAANRRSRQRLCGRCADHAASGLAPLYSKPCSLQRQRSSGSREADVNEARAPARRAVAVAMLCAFQHRFTGSSSMASCVDPAWVYLQPQLCAVACRQSSLRSQMSWSETSCPAMLPPQYDLHTQSPATRRSRCRRSGLAQICRLHCRYNGRHRSQASITSRPYSSVAHLHEQCIRTTQSALIYSNAQLQSN